MKNKQIRKKLLFGLIALILAAGILLPFLLPGSHDEGLYLEGSIVSDVKKNERKSQFADELEVLYIDPDRVYSTDVRWWLGEASQTDDTLLEEIQDLYDGGFRGVELCMQSDGNADDAVYAYGSDMWLHKWKLMMNELLDLGMGVYLTSGTNWATSNVPGLNPDSQAAMQCLIMGMNKVAAGNTISTVPAPTNGAKECATFVGAVAYKEASANVLEYDSMIDLTGLAVEGENVWTQNLSWTAPDDGVYYVFGIWSQGTYQEATPAAEPCYTINYFDERGVEAMKEFWLETYLSDPELVAKIAEGDVQLFMDSLEIGFGDGFTWWAEDMAEEFRERKGYDILPYVILTAGIEASVDSPYIDIDDVGTYKLKDNEELREKIINDYQDVLTELYMERLLMPLKEWLNSYGIKTRAQISYGRPLEISEPIMAVDYPEAENLNQYNQVDIFRLHTGGAKLENKVLSTETSALYLGYSYTDQLHLQDAYSAYAAGFQRVVWHLWGTSYSASEAEGWPVYNPGWGDVFYKFGSHEPSSSNYDEFNAHLGRIQQLMQTGVSRTDIGFVHQNWTQGVRFGGGVGSDNNKMQWQFAHQGVYYRSTELQNNGYTYDYFNPEFLFDEDVYFDTETQTLEQAGYKAIVLYQTWLDVDAAQKILEWAKQGLKVVILEDAGSMTPYNDGRDEELKVIISELKALDNVRTAEVEGDVDYFSDEAGGYEDNVLEMLQDLGVRPYAGYIEANYQLLTQSREDRNGNRYLYVYNYCPNDYHEYSLDKHIQKLDHGTTVQTEIILDGLYIPYVIDAWTGEVTEIGTYRWENNTTAFPITLDYNNIALYAFAPADTDETHIVSTNAEYSYMADGTTVARTVNSGKLTTVLSNGVQYQNEIVVPEVYDITGWNLTVESWTAGTPGDLVRTETIGNVTTKNTSTSTVKTKIDVKLDTMTTWDNIPEIGQNVVGTGHYEATFQWNGSQATGAYLDLGSTIAQSLEVWINGQKVGGDVSSNPTKVQRNVGGENGYLIDDGTGNMVELKGDILYTGGVSWTKPVVDISAYLVEGENTIVIEYSSALTNAKISGESEHPRGWWGYNKEFLSNGPQQARIVPFVEVEYPNSQAQLEVSISDAEQLLADVKKLDAEQVPTENVAALEDALDAAKTVLLEDTATERQLADALSRLVTAYLTLCQEVE